jgi:hypothetical protein
VLFNAPYFTWDPPASSAGSPTVVQRGTGPLGTRGFFLQSNPSHPSSAEVVSSLGVDAGVAPPGRRELWIQGTFDYDTYFYSGGVFHEATVAARLNVYLEEFDARGNYVGGRDVGEVTILHESTPWFSGSRSWSPNGAGWWVSGTSPVVAGHSYLVWIDLHGEIRAAGFGGFGGSAAIAQVDITLIELETNFSDPR